jgi:PHS family inorganic phosphate transporter-like MFS transporter
MPANTQLTISMASLVGTFLGQIIFGILGDRYGRKKMFYRLLVGLIFGTVFLALISRGAQESLDILALIVFWRIWMGVFIGGDYPLRSVMSGCRRELER